MLHNMTLRWCLHIWLPQLMFCFFQMCLSSPFTLPGSEGTLAWYSYISSPFHLLLVCAKVTVHYAEQSFINSSFYYISFSMKALFECLDLKCKFLLTYLSFFVFFQRPVALPVCIIVIAIATALIWHCWNDDCDWTNLNWRGGVV